MSITSYAQNFEDVLLWRALHDVTNGQYIDIGAHDPIIDSVSLAFYEGGWRGIHVEPVPFYAERLREARPEETVIQAAVTDETGPILFYELSGLSSGRKDIAEHHARSGHIVQQMLVPTVRLDQLLEMVASEVHWLKIDVEGMEAAVLRSWGDSDVRPWVLVVEATFPNSQVPTHSLWLDEVLRRGYEQAYFDGLSCYFLHEACRDLRSKFEAPPNIFDNFRVTANHFSAHSIRSELHDVKGQLSDQQAHVTSLTADLEASERRCEEQAARAAQLLHAINDAQQGRETARQELNRTLVRLASAEGAHREAQAASMAEQAELRDALEADRSALAEARVSLARLAERSVQLQHMLDREGLISRAAEARMQTLEQQLADSEQKRVAGREQLLLTRTNLSAELQSARAAVEEARMLIRNAATEKSQLWRRIGRALGMLGPSRQWLALQAWSERPQDAATPVATNQIPNHGMESSMNTGAFVDGGNPLLRANSLVELLSWNGIDFVRCAYVTVLGRRPDGQGAAYYLDRLQHGHSKMEILWQLRNSPEAASHDPGIAGFDRALRRARLRTRMANALGRRRADVSTSARLQPDTSPSAPSAAFSSNPDISGLIEADNSLRAELAQLNKIVEGMGHALKGLAAAQERHEKQLEALTSATSTTPAANKARRSKRALQ